MSWKSVITIYIVLTGLVLLYFGSVHLILSHYYSTSRLFLVELPVTLWADVRLSQTSCMLGLPRGSYMPTFIYAPADGEAFPDTPLQVRVVIKEHLSGEIVYDEARELILSEDTARAHIRSDWLHDRARTRKTALPYPWTFLTHFSDVPRAGWTLPLFFHSNDARSALELTVTATRFGDSVPTGAFALRFQTFLDAV